MNFLYIRPCSILSPYIDRVTPVDNIELMFHYKNPFIVKLPDNKHAKQPQSLICGIRNTYSDVSTQGEAGVIAVSFYPYAARNFFNFPLSEIENLSIHSEEIFKNEIRSIEEQICSLNTIHERIDIIEQFLIKKLVPLAGYNYMLIKNSISLIIKNKGQINATALSDRLNVTTKSLERKFSAYVGITPKQFIKIIRFREVVQELTQHTNNHFITKFAYDCGFFDQSHFIRNFKSFSGYTPKEFLTKYPCQTDIRISEFSA